MIIYTDQQNTNSLFGTNEELTPAQVYAAVNDFATILSDIQKDVLPTGSGRIFNVNWKTEEPDTNLPPWISNTNQMYQQAMGGSMLFNPYV